MFEDDSYVLDECDVCGDEVYVSIDLIECFIKDVGDLK